MKKTRINIIRYYDLRLDALVYRADVYLTEHQILYVSAKTAQRARRILRAHLKKHRTHWREQVKRLNRSV